MKWPIGKLLRAVAQALVPLLAEAALRELTKPRRAAGQPDASQPELPLGEPEASRLSGS